MKRANGWYGDRYRHYLAAKGVKTAASRTDMKGIREQMMAESNTGMFKNEKFKNEEALALRILEEEDNSSLTHLLHHAAGEGHAARVAEAKRQLAEEKAHEVVAKQRAVEIAKAPSKTFHLPSVRLRVFDTPEEKIHIHLVDDKPEYIRIKLHGQPERIVRATAQEVAVLRKELAERGEYLRTEALPDLNNALARYEKSMQKTGREVGQSLGEAGAEAKVLAAQTALAAGRARDATNAQLKLAEDTANDVIIKAKIRHYEQELQDVEKAELEFQRKLNYQSLELDSEKVSPKFAELKRRELAEEGLKLKNREDQVREKISSSDLNLRHPLPAGYAPAARDVSAYMQRLEEDRRRRFG